MVDAALNIAAEQVIEYSAYGAVLQRAGNRGPTAAPQNLYRTGEIDEFGRDDSWVAIAVATDEQWRVAAQRTRRSGLGRRSRRWPRRAAGVPARTSSTSTSSAWCRQRSGDEIVAALWPAGVPVAKVMQPHRQTELEQLTARGFFEVLDHPVNAPARFTTMPFRLSRGPRPSTSRRPRCWASTTTSCWPNSGCRPTRSRRSKPRE